DPGVHDPGLLGRLRGEDDEREELARPRQREAGEARLVHAFLLQEADGGDAVPGRETSERREDRLIVASLVEAAGEGLPRRLEPVEALEPRGEPDRPRVAREGGEVAELSPQLVVHAREVNPARSRSP